jgi:hypothetical protein
MLIINGKKPARKLNIYVNGKRKTSGGGAPPANPYQQWAGYPDSPLLTDDYPYQAIIRYTATYYIVLTTAKLYHDTDDKVRAVGGVAIKQYTYSGGVWVYSHDRTDISSVYSFSQANNDVYWEVGCTTTWFAQTTP